jgi:ABC-2 type transport system ATP-binding protein
MKGELLLLECEPLGAAVEALQDAPGVLDAAVFGNALHVLVPDALAGIAQLQTYLAARSVRVGKIESIRPSLEDVFVALTSEHEARKEAS